MNHSKPRILAFAGSARSGSFNRLLVQVASEGAAQAGAEVTSIQLGDYPLPLFDQDLEQEQGAPQNAVKLKQLFLENQGLLIASPEYNSSITPLLKNTIDWISRPAEGEPMLAAFKNKAATVMSASPGALGGLRGLVHVRSILSNIGVLVLPGQVAVPNAGDAFDEQGQFVDTKQEARVHAVAASLVDTVRKLAS